MVSVENAALWIIFIVMLNDYESHLLKFEDWQWYLMSVSLLHNLFSFNI